MDKKQKKKISKALKKYYEENPEVRERISERMKGNKFGAFKRSKETRERMSKSRKGIDFTDEHKENISKSLRGKVGPESRNWKGGIATSRPYDKVRPFSQEVMKRDNYTCRICNARNVKNRGKSIKLNSHHIKSWKDYPELRYDINNGITLCESCHRWVHSINVLDFQ